MAESSDTAKRPLSDKAPSTPSSEMTDNKSPVLEVSGQKPADANNEVAGDTDTPSPTTSAFNSPLVTAVDKLMAIPHIVNNILRHARQDRPSLARLMQTNRNMYATAGPILYYTAIIWEENIDSFFEGSFKRCSCADCHERAKEKWGIDHANGGLTAFGKLTAGPHSCGKYTNPPPREANDKDKDPAATAKSTQRKDQKGGKPGKTASDDGTTAMDGTKDSTNSKVKSKGTQSNNPVMPGEPKSTLPLSKRQLLAHVRILTVSTHHESACEIYAPHAAKYLVNLETLRIVETPYTPFQTFHICENIPGGSCPLIDGLAPRKLVVRNISGLPLPFPPLWTANPKTKEIVFVLPTELAAYAGKKLTGPQDLISSLVGQFNEVTTLRLVFWDGWDRSLADHPRARTCSPEKAADLRKRTPVSPLHVDDVASILRGFARTRRAKIFEEHRPRLEVYGLGAVQLSTHGISTLVDEYKAANPGKMFDLHTVAKLKAMRCEISMAMPSNGGRPILLGPILDITWFTLNNYKRKQFEAKISEWD